ncbi:MAG: ATP-grasp domain-containing protein [Pseudonocardiaceae bacterium]
MMLGIPRNPYATNVPDRLVEAAAELDIPVRVIDLPTVTVDIGSQGRAVVRDTAGDIEITSLAPYALFGCPTATYAFRILSRGAYTQNPVDSVLTADDKAATAVRLSDALLPQVPSTICSLNLERALSVADEIHYPVVIKRTHGARGRWVRRAGHAAALLSAFHELESEGPGSLILQPEVLEFHGRSIRAVITGGQLLAATLRTAAGNEWRSNIALGATQHLVDLTSNERKLAEDAARALGLGHAGIDIVRTALGPLVLEVNSCPDFTSMLPYFNEDLTQAVLLACLPSQGP